MAPERPRPRW